jgi:hypothetical protein
MVASWQGAGPGAKDIVKTRPALELLKMFEQKSRRMVRLADGWWREATAGFQLYGSHEAVECGGKM